MLLMLAGLLVVGRVVVMGYGCVVGRLFPDISISRWCESFSGLSGSMLFVHYLFADHRIEIIICMFP